MRTTAGTTTLPTNSQASHPQGRGSDERGVITLEWLLIVGAIAGLAATSVLAVQRVLDDTSEVPVDPLVRVLEADIAAAFVAADAQAAFDESQLDPLPAVIHGPGFLNSLQSRREGRLQRRRRLRDSHGRRPPLIRTALRRIRPDDEPARCVVKPLQVLGGS